jgi:methylated-DNA-protein-cysteine methyltransferase related protein
MSFRKRVYALVRTIPYGNVAGYGHVAAALGSPRAARQVGFALAALPGGTDVPWHRVLRSSGHIAQQGDPGRPLLQHGLLESEGIEVVQDHVAMERYGWVFPGPAEEMG